MPITPYLRPQDTITQILRNTPTPAVARRNPIVIGPQYLVQLNDGRALNKTVFNSSGVVDYGYKLADGSELDLDVYQPHAASVELFGEGLEAKVAGFDPGAVERVGVTNDSLVLGADNFAGGTLNTALHGRAVKVGDIFQVAVNSIVNRRKVIAKLPRTTAAVAAAALAKTAASTNFPTTTAGAIPVSGAGWTTPAVTAPVAPFLEVGGGHLDGSTRKLGEQFTAVATATAGGAGTARFAVTAVSSGQTSNNILSLAGTVATDFKLALDAVGYPGATVDLRIAGNTVTEGATVTFRVFPALTAVPTSALTVSGAYTGATNRRYVVEVTTGSATLGDAQLRIFDTSGAELASTDIADNLVSLGIYGLLLTFSNVALYKGAKFYIDAVAPAVSTTEFNGVRLSGPVLLHTYDSEHITVEVFQPYTGKLTDANVASGSALTATIATTEYSGSLGLSAEDAGRDTAGISPFANGVGKVFLSYKAAVIPGPLNGPIAVTSASAMASLVGEPHLENWLGRGVFEAFNGNQSQRVYALRTLDDTVESFTAALRKIRSTDIYYALAVMSDNIDVKTLVISHVEEMSNKFNKNFRRCYVGTDSPGKYTAWGLLSAGGYRKGSVISQKFTIDEEYRDNGLFTEDDLGSFIWVGAIGAELYTITRVLSSFEVEIDCDIDAVEEGSDFTLTRSDTAANTVRFLTELADVLGSRRCVNVWVDRASTLTSKGSEEIPNKFVAAEIAGLRCALLPQQGLTMTEIETVTAAPAMYTRFTPEQLDEIASYGNMVVTQEAEGGEIFIRHQLTTSTDEGALAYEDNVGVIVDEFSYRVKDTFRSYIGKRNATQNTITEIQNKLRDLADDATKTDIRDFDIGPMVIRFFDENGKEGDVTARIDGVLADHILTYVKLRVPLPLNGIDHYIDVETSVDL